MKTVSEHIRSRLLDPLARLRQTQWSDEFEQYMRNRLIMGSFRYGLLGAPGKPQYDRVSYARRCLDSYKKTGNLECLVDAANLALVEFVEGEHPKKHFRSDDDGEHAEVVDAP